MTAGFAVTSGWDVPVGDQSHVHGAVAAVQAAAVRAALTPAERAACALIATELATNLTRHARDGRMVVTATDPGAGGRWPPPPGWTTASSRSAVSATSRPGSAAAARTAWSPAWAPWASASGSGRSPRCFPGAAGCVFTAHTDGIRAAWDLSRDPGLAGHDPAITAALIWRDAVTRTDDAAVVVMVPATGAEASR